MNISKNRKKAIEILNIFEEKLEELNITLPSADRVDNKNEARIFGEDVYYDLENKITEKLEAD